MAHPSRAGQHTFTSRRSSTSSISVEVPLLANDVLQEDFALSAVPNGWTTTKDGGFSPKSTSLVRQGFEYAKNAFSTRKRHRIKGDRQVEVSICQTKPLVDIRRGKPHVGNSIRSNKYTLWTFIPRQLLAQFSKLANFYFLCFAILQLVPGLSTIGNKTNIIPLMVMVSISMAKEGFDDYRRHRLDQKENRRETLIIDTAAPLVDGALNWRRAKWQDLHVGDVINLKRDEPIPADVILLSSTSLAESSSTYVETTALDGEADLKRKKVVKSIAAICATAERLINCPIKFTIEDPTPDLSTFKGRVIANHQTSVLSNDNVIYRGSVLRNTAEVIAMIVYSGEECKIRINPGGQTHARIKAPLLQNEVNRIVILVVFIVVGLSVYNTLAYQSWKSDVERKLFYLSAAAVPFHEEIFGFVIMFATMVPLSLYSTLEIIKLAQIFLMNSDVDMYDEQSNTPFVARNSTINEDLGQVTHIFSDKTGTLTNNEMIFKKLYVGRSEWTLEDTENSRNTIPQSSSPVTSTTDVHLSSTRHVSERTTRDLVSLMFQEPHSALAQCARLMLLFMATCHSCVPEKRGDCIDFQASSPDELALVRAAQGMGFSMRNRDDDHITIEVSSPEGSSTSTETYEVLDVIDFSNDRKRMSVIVRFPDGRICIVCKGADFVIIERLQMTGAAINEDEMSQRGKKWLMRKPHEDEVRFPGDEGLEFSQAVIDDCIRSVNRFANESLRTLLYAYRFLGEQEYRDWKVIWDDATTNTSDHNNAIESAADLIETNFELAGATGIEDKLQKGVLESIDKLRRANIKIWMLTGDKRETAVNIGRSCGLIREHSKLFVLGGEVQSAELGELISASIAALTTKRQGMVVVDGHTLATIYDEASGPLEAAFFKLTVQADAVICCRAQPSQKAQLVSSIRRKVSNSVTLAVGDGANDIAMIQEAHIGIGITGKEGFQAARSSDYSIAQFRFLQKLLLVHGRWNYIRTSKYVLGTLWKEVLFFLPQALFQRWNGFTGTSFYEPWTLGTFNTFFTSLQVLAIGIFEKDLTASTLLVVPELYKTTGQSKGCFNIWIYLGWTAMAVAESMIIFFCILTLFANTEVNTQDIDLFPMGDLSFTAAVIVISMKLQGFETYDKSIVVLGCVFLSTGAAFLWNIILSAAYPPETPYKAHGAFFDEFGKNPTWWLTLIFIFVCVYVFECTVSICRKTLFPTDTDTFQELEHRAAAARNGFRETIEVPKWLQSPYKYEELRPAADQIDYELQELEATGSSS